MPSVASIGTNDDQQDDVTNNTTVHSSRVAVVTGAAQGIGREIALRLARDGLDVALNDVPNNLGKLEAVREAILEQGKETGNGRRCILIPGDVSKEKEVSVMIEEVVKELGGLDVMIANAGVAIVQPLIDMSEEDFDRIMRVNVRGVMLCYKYAARQMIKQGRGGRMIAASSAAGKGGVLYLSAYSASKFAIRGLTQCAAIELGKHGITVNAYAPGSILTAMMDDYDERYAELEAPNGKVKGDLFQKFATNAALGRSGTPAEVAGLVSFLVSEEARYITGQSITIDGGTHFD